MHWQAFVSSVNLQSISARPRWWSLKSNDFGSGMCDFRLNGAVVERVDRYKYLGFVFHATKGLHFGTEALLAVARKALFAMRQRRVLMKTLLLPCMTVQKIT